MSEYLLGAMGVDYEAFAFAYLMFQMQTMPRIDRVDLASLPLIAIVVGKSLEDE